jgi:hypothetical protein
MRGGHRLTVGHYQRDPVAMPNAEAGKRVRKPVGASVPLAVADRALAADS